MVKLNDSVRVYVNDNVSEHYIEGVVIQINDDNFVIDSNFDTVIWAFGMKFIIPLTFKNIEVL